MSAPTCKREGEGERERERERERESERGERGREEGKREKQLVLGDITLLSSHLPHNHFKPR